MINIPIYESIDIYNKCFNKIDENFEENNSPLLKAIIIFNRFKESKINKIIRFCLITNDFIDYKNTNKLEDSTAALQTYMKQMSDENAKKLWETTSYYQGEQMLLYPFLIINDKMPQKTFLNLDLKAREFFLEKTSISLKIKKENIYLPGYITSFNTILEKGDMLEGLGISHLYENKKITFSIMEEQTNDTNSNIFPFTIPFFIKKELNYKLSFKDLENYYTNNDFLKKDNAEEISKKIKEIIITDNSFQIFAIIDDFIIKEEIPEIYNEIESLVNNFIKKKHFFNIFNKKK